MWCELRVRGTSVIYQLGSLNRLFTFLDACIFSVETEFGILSHRGPAGLGPDLCWRMAALPSTTDIGRTFQQVRVVPTAVMALPPLSMIDVA